MKQMATELDYMRSQNDKLGRESQYLKEKLGHN